MTLVFDLETNGLLNDVTRIHCLAIYDSTTDEIETYNDEKNNKYSISEGIGKLLIADTIVGHNIIGLSRLYFPHRLELDSKKPKSNLPLQLRGRHSLEAYGYRLGEYKGEFGKTSDWSEWSQEMEDYCAQDVVVTTKLCDHFHKYLTS